MKKVSEILITELSISGFKMNIRTSVRGLWAGHLIYAQAYDNMVRAIERGLEQAWNEGAAECGISPDERTGAEQLALDEAIRSNVGYVKRFLDHVEASSKANKGKLTPLFTRADLWITRYNEVQMRASAMACADQKFIWRLGPTKEHCSSCLKLNGKVKRGSQWTEAGIYPKHPDLECGGWKCECTRTKTDAPMSKGALPRIP